MHWSTPVQMPLPQSGVPHHCLLSFNVSKGAKDAPTMCLALYDSLLDAPHQGYGLCFSGAAVSLASLCVSMEETSNAA